MLSLYLYKNINLNHIIMKTISITLNAEFIVKVFFLTLIVVSLGSLIIGLFNGLDTTPLN